MTLLTPWELARLNKVEVVKRLQENGCILLALKNRGRKGGYNRPFAAIIEWPPSLVPFEVDGQHYDPPVLIVPEYVHGG